MDQKQSIRNQTRVATTLATHLLLSNNHSNLVLSPLSIHAILCLMAAGSKGPTLHQLLAFLKANTVDELNRLSSQIASFILADGSPTDPLRLSYVNGVWIDKTVSLKPAFNSVVDGIYKAACNQVDFKTKAKEVAAEVNSWVERYTNSLIKQLLPPGAVNSFTRLIFVNAVYFKGAWAQTFDRSKTKEFDFHLLDGSKVQVPFMTSKKPQFISEYSGFKVAGLSYLGQQEGHNSRKFAMYFFLPNAKDGLQSLVEEITSKTDFFDNHIPYQKEVVGRFLIPRFKISFDFEASRVLKELGLVLPFQGEDCLAEMIDSSVGERPSVSSIIHKSLVEVNEEGTEAAAATEFIECGCARPMPVVKKVDFVADHPFLFLIREDKTGVVLFIGQVTHPHVG